MKAIVCTRYGPPEVLQLREVKKPIPRSNEILIKIYATTVTSSDCIARSYKPPIWHPMGMLLRIMLGFKKPRNPILGTSLAGIVESVGKNVRRFRKGDQIFASTVKSIFQVRLGAYAQYVCLPENWRIALKPSNITYEEAAAIPYGGSLALYYLKKGNIQNRKKVLVHGASGAVGTYAVQLAKYFGADVTGVCSTANLELVKSLGADKVIDYTKEDFTEYGELYDLIFDAVPFFVANRKSLKLRCKKVLKPGGKYISVDDGIPRPHIKDFILLKELVETGNIRPVIDRVYSLEQIPEAHRYVEKGHKKGNVVITIKHDDE